MSQSPGSDDTPPRFDQAFADALVGKVVLVGLTYEDRRGEVKRQEEFFGTVIGVDARRGIALALNGTRRGETKWLPPATTTFEVATKGRYRLRSTGEVVDDPAYTAQWRVVQPDA